MSLRYPSLVGTMLVMFAIASRSPAQQSLFQTANGDSAIFLPGGAGVASYNLGNDTARFDFERDQGKSRAYGGGIGGTVKTGVASLINKNSPAPGGFAEGGALLRFNKAISRECTYVKGDDPDITVVGPAPISENCRHQYFHFIVIQFRYGRSQFYTLPSSSSPIATPLQRNFDQFRGTLSYNGLWKNRGIELGLAYVPASANNLSDLKQETYQTEAINTTGGTQTTLSPSSKTVYVGNYLTHFAHGVNGDVVFQPHKAFNYQLAFDLMFRSDLGGGSGVRYGSPGLGFFFFKKGSPAVPIGGVAYSYRSGESQVSIVTGWTFGGTAPPAAKASKDQ